MTHPTAEAAITAALVEAEKNPDFYDFDGQNCDDYNPERNCAGWDGLDRRCECGNRRVSWETYGDATTGFTAYGRAY